MQAHQKDAQIEAILSTKVLEVVRALKGQLYSSTHPLEISIAVKLMYLCLTTLTRSRTLGEEYVDLIYVGRRGNKLVEWYKKLLYILLSCIGPYYGPKYLQKWRNRGLEANQGEKDSLKNALKILVNLHLVLFYFKGAYYDIFKRVFGLRYAIGHKVDTNEAKFRKNSSNSYKFLGYILLVQGASKVVPKITKLLRPLVQLNSNMHDTNNSLKSEKRFGTITGFPEESQILHVDLSDDSQLPYIPKASRSCILCLNTMTDPSCAPCGHVFCWDCILNWCKERPECPLCRQKCQAQQVLSLR